MLRLEDCLDDSPQTKNLVDVYEKDSQIFKKYILEVYKNLKHISNSHKDLCLSMRLLSENLKFYDKQEFPLEQDDSMLSSVLTQFGTKFEEMSSIHEVISAQLSEYIHPLTKFIQTDLDEIFTLKEVYASSRNDFERVLDNWMRFPKKKENEKLKSDLNQDFFIAKKKFHETALHYFSSLNQLQLNKKSALLSPIIGFVKSEMSGIELTKDSILNNDSNDLLQNMSSSIDVLQAELKVLSLKNFDEIEKLQERSIQKYFAEPEKFEKPNVELNQKAGYLYIKMKTGVLSASRWERCYFFIQGGHLMCQNKNEFAGSSIIELEQDIILNNAEYDDRRFVFQIQHPSSKKIVILQAENNIERNQWITAISNSLALNSSDHKNFEACLRKQLSASLTIDAKRPDRLSEPPTPPSTPIEGDFFPDTPIQFDLSPAGLQTVELELKRVNPFDESSHQCNLADGDGLSNSSYDVRFLGSQQVPHDRGNEILYETIRQIMTARAIHNIFKMTNIKIIISSEKIRLVEPATSKIITEFILEDVSFWGVHEENKRLFSFITRTKGATTIDAPTFICHAFECNVSGEEICQALSVSTKIAFQNFLQKKSLTSKDTETTPKDPTKDENFVLIANLTSESDIPKHLDLPIVKPADISVVKMDKPLEVSDQAM